jgi:chromosome segregation ATPase
MFNTPNPGPSGSGSKIPILFGAVVALVGATAYQFYQINQLRTELTAQLTETKDQLAAQMGKIHETNTVSTQTNKRSMEQLKKEVDAARAQASTLAGAAKVEAEKHADELASKLTQLQEQQAKQVAAVGEQVTQVREDANATKTRVGEVSSDLNTVKTEAAATRSELEKTIAALKTTQGDLGVESGRIATNAKELAALRQLGERNYTEFRLAKEKSARKVGDIMIKLKSADPKKNRYTIEVTADDKLVEKKDKTINEPVQFMLSRATIPFELVVNDIKKDVIAGYLAAPKVQQSRN